ncbi:DUF4105 domain-containing protein [uncultured Roseibium sp.]|uniref:lipoprotein N-acyltransferase Lnb domain-containing protein n=1 Tax=uncultured Roseibium sp. TaxID=1936171 RepID=UPI0026213DD4|nr:DUF4105 domain-containing protein [uncultured Roseibium sp.]
MKKRLARLLGFLAGLAVILASTFMAAASYYWLGWPDWLRTGLALCAVPGLAALWFVPGTVRHWRRVAVIGAISLFLSAYSQKELYPQSFVPLHERIVDVKFDGDLAEIINFRDAVHQIDEPAQPRWTTRTFDLNELSGIQLIYQPFGNSAATVHVMMSFAFSNGDHLAVSFEARRTSWDTFDAVAGFFKHDQLYPVLGTERDLLWKRLARVPPNDLYFFDLEGTGEEGRAYLRHLLEFVASLHQTPQFYSTISESCFTTLLKLSPRLRETVPWYDLRRWVPGASVGLFQELGLIDSSVSEEELLERQKLRPDIRPPWEFEDANTWSSYLRSRVGRSDQAVLRLQTSAIGTSESFIGRP